MLKLQFRDQRKPAIWLVNSHYAIGSDPQNDIVLNDAGVSPHHAHMQVEDYDRVFITDAGSAQGTRVNGEAVDQRKPVQPGDVIAIHSVELELLDPKEQPRAAGDAGATAVSPAVKGLAGQAPVTAGQPEWMLKPESGAVEGQSRAIPAQGTLTIGRSRSCDLVLPSKHVSRRHARIYIEQGRPRVRDLGSSNGTYVNQQRVEEQDLHSGDEIRFDNLVFRIQGPDAPATGPDSARSDSTTFRTAIDPEPAGDAVSPEPRPDTSFASLARPGPGADRAAVPAGASASPAESAPADEISQAGTGSGRTLLVLALAAAVVVIAGWWLL